jgi:hypothetical protein
MSCLTPVEFSQGAVISDAKLLDPAISNGTATNLQLTNAKLVGAVQADDAAWESLAAGIEPLLAYVPPKPEDVAKVFKNCSGAPLVSGHFVSTCEDLDDAKTTLEAEIATKSDPARILKELLSGEGLPIVPGTKIPTWTEVLHLIEDATTPAVVAATFQNSEGNALSPNTQLLSKAEIIKLIQSATADDDESSGMHIAGVNWNPDKTRLTISESDGATWPIDFSDFAKATSNQYATNPMPLSGTELPLNVIGARSALLGEPAAFFRVTVNGVTYACPLFAL